MLKTKNQPVKLEFSRIIVVIREGCFKALTIYKEDIQDKLNNFDFDC